MRTSLFIMALAAATPLTFAAIAPAASAAGAPPLTGVIINWSTNTYVPSAYVGKRLPTANSPVNAWVAVFDNGKPVDASQYDIRWYAGDQLIQSGTGIVSVSFNAPSAANQVVNLQARVQSPAGSLTVANSQLPVISPVLAIGGDYPGNIFTTSTADLTALPYFFNVQDASALTYSWTANGQAAQNAENPQDVTINIGNGVTQGTTIAVALTATNSSDGTSATANAAYTYSPQ